MNGLIEKYGNKLYWKRLTDLFFPPTCPVCGAVKYPQQREVCRECRDSFRLVQEPRCKRCSKPIVNTEREYCFDCGRKQHAYDEGKAVFEYNQAMKESIYRYKYAGKKEYSSYYINKMISHSKREIMRWQPEVAIPVPLHAERLRTRGFNQAEVLARGIAAAYQLQLDTRMLIRQKRTLPQKDLSNRERYYNMKGTFGLASESCRYQRVLLIDDIYTTGSTIDEIAGLLKKHGAVKVYYLVLSIAAGA